MKNFIKNLLWLLMMCLSALPASAYDFEVDGICYDITSFTDLTVTATSLTETAPEEITIPNKVVFNGKELTVTIVAPNFAINNTNLTKVILNSKKIGNSAFKNCTNLNTIILQDSVRTIDDECFRGCETLKQIIFSDSISEIGNSSFRDCSEIESFCSKGIQILGKYSFYNCQKLISIDLPKLSYIPSYAFGKCTLLKEYNTPNITAIKEGAFSECVGLEECNIPVSVKDIGSEAFKQTSIKQVIIPDNVTALGSGVFNNCIQLSSATIGSGINILYPIFDGCVNLFELTISDSYETLNVLPYTSSGYESRYGGEYASTNGSQVTVCPGYFSGLNLKNVYVGRNIKQPAYKITRAEWFKRWAIYGYDGEKTNYYYNVYNSPFASSKISSITFGPYVSDIVMTDDSGSDSYGFIKVKGYEGKGTLHSTKEGHRYTDLVSCSFRIKGIFESCTDLEEIIFIGTSIKVPEFAFQYCTNLKTITLPYLTEEIGKQAFNGCTNLQSVDLGVVSNINDNVFQDCDNLSLINILSSNPPTYATGFNSATYISTNLNIPENVIDKYKSKSPWSNFWNITTDSSIMPWHIVDRIIYSIDNNIASVVGNTLPVYSKVTLPNQIEINNSVKTVKNIISLAFKDCFLESLSIPSSICFFGINSFSGCLITKTLIFEDGEEMLIFPSATTYTSSSTQSKTVNGQTVKFGVQYYDGYFKGLPIEELYLGRGLSDKSRYTISGDGVSTTYKIVSFDGPFYKLPNLKKITIGEMVKSIGPKKELIPEIDVYQTSGSFTNCSKIDSVFVNSLTPPIGAEFASNVYSNAKLFVPENKVLIYSEADGWKDFTNIYDSSIIYPSSILLNKDELTIKVGEEFHIIASVLPEDVTDKNIVWKSSDNSIVTVSNIGVISGISIGYAMITATCGDISATCEVTVTEEAGVEDVVFESKECFNVYNLEGILVKDDITIEDLSILPTGYYIIVSPTKTFKIKI